MNNNGWGREVSERMLSPPAITVVMGAGSSCDGKLGRNAGNGGGATQMGQQTTGLTTAGLKTPGIVGGFVRRLSVMQCKHRLCNSLNATHVHNI